MSQALQNLQIPVQDLPALTQGSHAPKKLRRWVDALPLINVSKTSGALYQYLQQLNRLPIDPKSRIELLEILRPAVDHCCQRLSSNFLRQPVVLPAPALKAARLSLALQGHLVTGYKIATVHLTQNNKKKNKTVHKLMALAIQRAMHGLSTNLLRCLQLYHNPQTGIWLDAHNLNLLAEENSIHKLPVGVADYKFSEFITPASTYHRMLLLGTAQTNQLRQNDIALLFQLTEVLSPLLTTSQVDENNTFLVNHNQDFPPQKRSIGEIKADSRWLGTNAVCDLLTGQVSIPAFEQYLLSHGKLPDSLLNHLVASWEQTPHRSFSRRTAQGSISICLGLNALHYHLTSGRSFQQLIQGDKAPSLQNKQHGLGQRFAEKTSAASDDPWASAHDAGTHNMSSDITFNGVNLSTLESSLEQEPQDTSQNYPEINCQLVNSSPGGYCVRWHGAAVEQLRSGEITGIKTSDNDGWSIGVVRWVRQLAPQGVEFGIELFAPRGDACGVRSIIKNSQMSDYLRAIMLPELAGVSQPATLILPNPSFHERQQVMVNEQGEELKMVLTSAQTLTPSFTQFQFKAKQQPLAETLLSQPEHDAVEL